MPQVGDAQIGSLEFSLAWNSPDARHLERLHANKVNFWRDIFPGDLRRRLEGLETGQSARVQLLPGCGLPGPSSRLLTALPLRSFSGLSFQGRKLTLRAGRYYPRGRIQGLPGVFDVGDLRPARVAQLGSDGARLDLNHPLAGRGLEITATVLDLRPKPGDTGGFAHHWFEELCGNGPGMQAALPGRETDFGGPESQSPEEWSRLDQRPDAQFYAEPRLVAHLDAEALRALTAMYAARLRPGMRVLDLMAAQDSHLPEAMDLRVTGLGMNIAELEANPRLGPRLVQDLNANPELPLPSGAFDAVLLSLSVEYLTQPRAVLAEAARVLAPGGRLLVSFSDRYFPAKALRVWSELHDFERLGMVLGHLRATPGLGGLGTESLRQRPRPAEDPHAHELRWSDPVYLAEAVCQG